MPANPEDRKIKTLEDLEHYAFEPRHAPLPVPTVGIFDAPYACAKINQTWATHILGYVAGLLRADAWFNGGAYTNDEDARYFAHNEVMKLIEQMTIGLCEMDCNDIEACLTSSAIIAQLQASLVTQGNSLNNLQDQVDEQAGNYQNNTNDNVFPPMPTSATPDILCGSAYKIADELIALVSQTFQDAGTITLQEFLTALLGLGGFDSSLLVLFWQFAIANLNGTVPADVSAKRDKIAEILYCNELNKGAVFSEFGTEPSFSAGVKGALQGATNAVTGAKWALWAFVGSMSPSNACNAFCPQIWTHTFDFATGNQQGWQIVRGADNQLRSSWDGSGWRTVNEGNSPFDSRSGIYRDFPNTHIIDITLNYTSASAPSAIGGGYGFVANAGNTLGNIQFNYAMLPTSPSPASASVNATTNRLRTDLFSTAPTGTFQGKIVSIVVTGTGDNPFD